MQRLDRFDYNNYRTNLKNTNELKAQLEAELSNVETLNVEAKKRLALRCLRLAEFYLHSESAPEQAQHFINFAVENLTDHQYFLAINQMAFYFQQRLFAANKELREINPEESERIGVVNAKINTLKVHALEKCQITLDAYVNLQNPAQVKAVIFAHAVRALTFYEINDGSMAYLCYTSAIELSRKHKIYDIQYYRMLNRAAMIAAEINQLNSAKSLLAECKAFWDKLLEEDPYNDYAARYLLTYGDFLANDAPGQFSQAFLCYQRAYIIQSIIRGRDSALALEVLAKSLSFTRYNVHTAGPTVFAHIELAQEFVHSNKLSEKLKYQLAYAVAIYYLFKERDLASARTYLEICYSYTKPKEESQSITAAHAEICNLIGHAGTINPTYKETNYFEVAEKFYRAALAKEPNNVNYQLELVFALRYLALHHHRSSMVAARKNDATIAAQHAQKAVALITEALEYHTFLLPLITGHHLHKISHAEVLHLRGVMLRQAGNEADGIASLYDARSMEEIVGEFTGYPHFLEATTDQSLADALMTRKDIPQNVEKIRAEAESRLLAALNLQNKLFITAPTNERGDKEHEDVQKTLHFLGKLYQLVKDYKQAAEYYQRSADVKRITMGPDHAFTKEAEDLAQQMRDLAITTPAALAVAASTAGSSVLSPFTLLSRPASPPHSSSASATHIPAGPR